ncbi:MAG: response regulator transcription factor [Cyanobacteria bacterium SZAS-4]|nr:response regulator transcription factor [Cyanobacteria bacterium SZAS-4]
MAKILVVEDDPQILKIVQDCLKLDHHTVETEEDGSIALEKLRLFEYDVLIFDWNLPGVSGVELCREYRSRGGRGSVLMLTANTTISNKEEGLGSGADDYLTKPFEVRELTARVKALARRSSVAISANNLKVGDVELDRDKFCVTVNQQPIKLVPKEFALLEFLMRHRNIVFSADALLSRVWKAEEDASPEIIRTHIKNLRKKLEHDGKPPIIETVYGVGYKVVDPETV